MSMQMLDSEEKLINDQSKFKAFETWGQPVSSLSQSDNAESTLICIVITFYDTFVK